MEACIPASSQPRPHRERSAAACRLEPTAGDLAAFSIRWHVVRGQDVTAIGCRRRADGNVLRPELIAQIKALEDRIQATPGYEDFCLQGSVDDCKIPCDKPNSIIPMFFTCVPVLQPWLLPHPPVRFAERR